MMRLSCFVLLGLAALSQGRSVARLEIKAVVASAANNGTATEKEEERTSTYYTTASNPYWSTTTYYTTASNPYWTTTTDYPRTSTTGRPWPTTTYYPGSTTTGYPWTTTEYWTTRTTGYWTTTYPWKTTTTYPYTHTTTSYPWDTTTKPWKTTTTPWKSTTTPDWLHCPVGWIYEEGVGCFKIFQENHMSWLEAEQFCEEQADNSHLAEANTDGKYELLLGLAEVEFEFTGYSNFYIGMTDIGREGDWVWIYSGDQLTYNHEHWAPGHPATGSNSQDCGLFSIIDYGGYWKDVDCSIVNKDILPVCEIRTQPDYSTTTWWPKEEEK